jgi:uncharacterized protein (TIGR03435 family)
MKDAKENVGNHLDRLLSRYDSPSSDRMKAAIDRVEKTLRWPGDQRTDATTLDSGTLRRVRSFNRLVLVAAAIVLAVGVSAYFRASLLKGIDAHAVVKSPDGSLFRVSGETTQVVHLGERIELGEVLRASDGGAAIALADGSRVELRSQAEFSVEQEKDGIRIHLRKGSLIVNAAKQVAGHLYVQTKDVVVSVIGTVFLVNAEDQGSRVAVIEGEVRLQHGEETRTLISGEQFATSPTMEPLPVKVEVSWSQNAEEHVALLPQAAVQDVFEVASIKQRPDGGGGGGGQRSMVPDPNAGGPCSGSRTINPGRIVITRATLNYLISLAYGVGGVGEVQTHNCRNAIRMNLLSGGPDWAASRQFDIEALIPGGTPAAEPRLRTMLQNLLTERFKLQIRKDAREVAVYFLFAGRNGPKLSALKEGESTAGGGLVLQPGGAALISEKGPLTKLANRLSTAVNRPVLDRTGIAGNFEVQLLFAPTTEYFSIMGYAAPDPTAQPSLFTALEEELGLKLESARAPVDVWTIVSAQVPSEN